MVEQNLCALFELLFNQKKMKRKLNNKNEKFFYILQKQAYRWKKFHFKNLSAQIFSFVTFEKFSWLQAVSANISVVWQYKPSVALSPPRQKKSYFHSRPFYKIQ